MTAPTTPSAAMDAAPVTPDTGHDATACPVCRAEREATRWANALADHLHATERAQRDRASWDTLTGWPVR